VVLIYIIIRNNAGSFHSFGLCDRSLTADKRSTETHAILFFTVLSLFIILLLT